MSSATVRHETARQDSARQEPGRSPARPDALTDPWLWAAFGFAACVVAAGLSRAGVDAPWIGSMVSVGLLAVGIGAAIKLSSREPSRGFALKTPVLFLLVAFQAITAVLVTWSLIAAFAGVDPTAPTRSLLFHPPPLHPGLAIVLWLLIGPMTIVGTLRTWSHLGSGAEMTPALEKSVMLMQAALACLAAGFALAPFADTLAFFFSILTGFLAASASWTALSMNGRWLVLSAVFVTHFLMIINATLAAPPSSWMMGQLWTRMSRPYLEFMYLNNAYHFYAPDPGPASYLWFRVYFKNAAGESVDAKWVKVPDIDPIHNSPYRVALEYQRHLSVTENTVGGDSPPLFVSGPDGKLYPSESFSARIWNSPGGQKEILGQPKQTHVMDVPFHPFLNNEAQIHVPALAAKFMFESYVRYIAHLPYDVPPGYEIDFIRVYLVTHIIPPWQVFTAGMEPTDPEFYRPYYMGKYFPDGKLVDDKEPLLYWLLPILRDNPAWPDSPIRSYAHAHAGDAKFMHVTIRKDNAPVQRRWVNEQEANRLMQERQLKQVDVLFKGGQP